MGGGGNMNVVRIVKHSGLICGKDLLEFSRSKLRLIMLVLMPLFMMVMVGFVFPSGDMIEDQPVAIANLDVGTHLGDNGTISYGEIFEIQLEAINNQTGMLEISHASSEERIKEMVREGKLTGGIIIPMNFTSNILSGKQGEIIVITDESNPQVSMMIQNALSRTIDAMGTQMAQGNLNSSFDICSNQTLSMVKPYRTQFKGIIDGDPNYFTFVAPGIMAMVVMMSLMTGLPHAISYEKDIGTLDGMLVAPVSRLSIILGKVMAQTVRGMVQGCIILLLALILFGVVVHGNILLVFLLLILTVFSFVGLGILITSFTDKEETAAMVMMTFMFPMMFLSGVFFPVQQMPWFMQYASKLLPLTYAAQALRKVMVLGAGIESVWLEICILLGFGVVMLAIAIPMFKRAMSR